MIGKTLATRYRIERELGRGGMATVYLGQDLRLSRPVAVKVMHPMLGETERQRFAREAEIVASLRHPNILEIYDVGATPEGLPFLVTELIDGENLRKLTSRLAPLTPQIAAVLGAEISRALAAAHSRGIVHRDVKPENVLVGRGGPLKLADFGIAAAVEHSRLTVTGGISGSLAYMAPERIDNGEFSCASDVYAVGVIIYELCAGKTPFEGKGAAHLAAAVLTRAAPALSEVCAAVPEELSGLVDRCLARDPALRPTDGTALEAELGKVVATIVGPAADEARRLLADPEGYAANAGESRYQALLAEGARMLELGEGVRAARALDAAVLLRPGALEVRQLLSGGLRPAGRRWVGLVVAGLVLVAGSALAIALSHDDPSGPIVPAPAALPAPILAGPAVSDSQPARSPALTLVTSPPGSSTARPSTNGLRSPGSAVSGSSARLGQREPATRAPGPAGQPAGAAQPAESTQGASPEAAARASGTLRLSTQPWAEVFIDGTSRGFTPRFKEIELAPGSHALRLTHPLCDPVEEEISIEPGKSLVRMLRLTVRKAELVIEAPSGAELFVDGLRVGFAPLPAPLSVDHGRRLVGARVGGKEWGSREISATAGQRAHVRLEEAP